MSVKKKGPKQAPRGDNLIAAICAQVEGLLREHMPEILKFLDDSEDKKVSLSHGTIINMAESEPQIEQTLRFSQSVTDKRSCILDNPDQGSFAPVLEGADAERKKRQEKNLEKAGLKDADEEKPKGKKDKKKPGKGKDAATVEEPPATT